MLILTFILIIITLYICVKAVKLSEIAKENKKKERELNKLSEENEILKRELEFKKVQVDSQLESAKQREKEAEDKYNEILEKYKEQSSKGQAELDAYFSDLRQKRQQEFDNEFESLVRANEARVENERLKEQQKLEEELTKINALREAAKKEHEEIDERMKFEKSRLDALIAPMKQYEMDKQERLYYTIQIPDEYKEDIDFLITTVSQKIRHPDIINKLVWSEYVRPYFDDLVKRTKIEDKPGIYKITSLTSGKAYIGKSTNVKKRLQDHFKASVGITTIGWQAVHDAIAAEGIWNWTIEVINYCDKDKLSELEKYYIDYFGSVSFGYNRRSGG